MKLRNCNGRSWCCRIYRSKLTRFSYLIVVLWQTYFFREIAEKEESVESKVIYQFDNFDDWDEEDPDDDLDI